MDTITGMRTFASVVVTGSFTAAAERLGMSKALTSKYVDRLETRLGVRLLNRTTRQVSVTESGHAYYQRCCQLLESFDELEATVKDLQASPRGTLKIAAPTAFGNLHLTKAIAAFLDEQPGVSVDLLLEDRYVNLVDENFDLAVRIGALADSSLVARRLATGRMLACAAPAYLGRAGTPREPADLASHNCIVDSHYHAGDQWQFRRDGHRITVKVRGRFRANNVLSARDMALAGQGIALLPDNAAEDKVRDGTLVALLPQYRVFEHGIYVVYPHGRHLAAKIRVFVNFLVRWFGAFPQTDA